MEYEIEDDGALFDASTNPSLDHSGARGHRGWSSIRRDRAAPGKREPHKGELIPDEEEVEV